MPMGIAFNHLQCLGIQDLHHRPFVGTESWKHSIDRQITLQLLRRPPSEKDRRCRRQKGWKVKKTLPGHQPGRERPGEPRSQKIPPLRPADYLGRTASEHLQVFT